MAITIRLTPQIETLAKSYCERVGISLNGLIGVALDAYLQRPETAPGSAPAALQPEPVTPAPVAARSLAPATSKPVAAIPEPASGFTPPADPKPYVGPNPTKREKAKLADWYRRNPAK